MDTNALTLRSFGEGLRAGKFSALEATQEYFKAIEARDGELGAYLTLLKDDAVAAAGRVDRALAEGEHLGPLAGAPLAVKDNILIEGAPATAASRMLEHYRASYDATVIRKLKEADAVFLGKTNLDEFAMGSSTEYSAFKVTKNPYDPTRVPGGSSGGSAAAVAAGLALAGLGSDTSGSICLPAAFCGIVGLRPTYGAVSRFGLIAMGSSLDQIGPLARTVEDAALLFNAIRGQDPLDATSTDFKFENTPLAPEKAKKMVVGIPKEYFIEGIDPRVSKGIEAAVERLKSLGLTFKEISLPHTKYALSVYYIIMPAEVSTNLARFEGVRYPGIPAVAEDAKSLRELYFKTRGAGFGPEPRRRILLGTFVLSSGYYDAYYAKAQRVRRLIKEDFDRAFDPAGGGVNVILAPVSPTPAFKFGEKLSDPLAMYLSDIFTTQTNLAGIPALSLPVKNYPLGGKELPIGFQLIGRPFHEADILGIGRLYEKEE